MLYFEVTNGREQSEARLREYVDEILGLYPDDLVRPEMEGDSFAPYTTYFASVVDILRDIRTGPLDALPQPALDSLVAFVDTFRQLTDDIQRIKLTTNNWQFTRRSVGDKIEQHRNSSANIMAPLALLHALRVAKQSTPEEVKQVLKVLESDTTRVNKLLEEMQSDGRQLIANLQGIAQETALSKHAAIFATEAKDADESATRWLKGTVWAVVLLSVAVVLHLVVVFVWPVESKDPNVIIQQSVAKVITYSFLGTVVVWLGRNFRLARHNSIVNKHRANALSCFEALALSTSSPDVRHAILLQATQSIFSQQATGYIEAEREQSGAAQVLEIHRGAFAAAKKDG